MFFYICSAAPPALPSFPTRRSSDLAGVFASTRTMADRAFVSKWLERPLPSAAVAAARADAEAKAAEPLRRSEEHTSELQSLAYLVCRLLLEKKKNKNNNKIQ